MSGRKGKYKIAGVAELREILEVQKYRCALTGADLKPDNTSFDHRIPLSMGGNSLKENLQAVTKRANQSKGQLSMEDYVRLCFDVINHVGKEFGYRAKKIPSR